MKRFFTLLFTAFCLTAFGQVPGYVPTDGLVAWYPLDGDVQEAIHDSLDGIFPSAVSLAEGNRFGQQGRALGFVREEQTQVVLPPLLDLSNSEFTLSGWFKSTALETSQAIINTIPRNILALGYNHGENLNAQHVSLWLDDDDSGWDISFNGHSEQSFALDLWHHVVVIRSGDAVSLYVNGELDWTLAISVNIGSAPEGLVLGSINGTEFFNGSLDDFGFWHRALTDEEVLELFNAPATVFGCTDPLACNYYEAASIDDGTCASCEALATACGEGTVWDSASQTCIVANPSDSNFDGCVQLNDLLDLLSAYGDCGAEESSWQCGDPLEHQGYDYVTVEIGEQCWFSENLRSESYENGDAIPSSVSDSEWSSTTSGAVALYGEDAGCQSNSPNVDACDPIQSLNEYGRLYNWYAVDDSRGLCPSGWHVPTDEEWTVMTDHLGGESTSGSQMKTTYGWFGGGNGMNSAGFSGLPGGYRFSSGYFGFSGFGGNWWSSSPDVSVAWGRGLDYYDEAISRNTYNPLYGFSVRCIKDAE